MSAKQPEYILPSTCFRTPLIDASPHVSLKAMNALQAQDLAAIGHEQGSTGSDNRFDPEYDIAGEQHSVDALIVELEKLPSVSTPRQFRPAQDMAAFLDKKDWELNSKGPWHPLSLSDANACARNTAMKPSQQEILKDGGASDKEDKEDKERNDKSKAA
jgi:hypothetical protein